MRWRATGYAALACLGLAAPAWGAPSIWETVKDPRLERSFELERVADRNRVSTDPAWDEGELDDKLNERAAMMILMAGGEQLGSPELLMLLGDCLANAPAAYQPQAVNVLRDALENAPNAPQAAASWVNLAFALETLGELDSAVEAFSQALFLEWHSERRAVIYHERGRMQLGSGALEAAIGDFEAGLSSGFGAEARALAHWSLGVAHDRNHDFPTAIPHLLEGYRARFGSNGATLIIDLDDSIIWPPEERHYYRALALLAEAMEERAVNHGRFISLLVESQFVWLSYLQDAPAESLGVPRAREHLQWVREQLQQDDVETDADLDEQLLRPAW